MALPVNFDADSASRIYRAVREVERGNRDQQPLTFRRVAEQGTGGTTPTSQNFHVATFTGAWAINQQKVVTLYQATSTLLATNLIIPIPGQQPGVTPNICMVAKDRAEWYLVNAQMGEVDALQSVTLTPTELLFSRVKVIGITATHTTTAIAITECDIEAASAEQLDWFLR